MPTGSIGSRMGFRASSAANVHIGIAWLESVAFGHTKAVGARVLIIGEKIVGEEFLPADHVFLCYAHEDGTAPRFAGARISGGSET